ncbi:MAG: sensor histidine kinase [Rhodospirillales bacterium]|nr:sensor histidine kinase [Rhodospirillales bacterium]
MIYALGSDTGGTLRDIRPNMALLVILAVITAGLIAAFPAMSQAQESRKHFLINSNGPQNRIDLNQFLTRLTTDRPRLDPAQLITLPETEFEAVLNTAGPGYTTRTVWYRVPFEVEEDDDDPASLAFLEMGAAYLNDIRVSVLSDQTSQAIWSDRVGDRIANPPEKVASLKHISQWPKLAPGHYWLTIAVRTNSAHIFNASLSPEAVILTNAGHDTFVKGSYIGLLIIAFGVYLTFGILSRDRSVNWYACYIFSLLLVHLGTSGFAQLFLKNIWPLASDLITGTGAALSFGSSVAMWAYIIRLNRYAPIVFRVIMGFATLAILGSITATTDLYVYFAKLFFFPNVCVLVTLLGYLIYIGYREKRLISVSFYLIALGIPTIAAIIYLLTLLGILPINGFTTGVYSTSSAVHLIMIAIAMANRTRKVAGLRAEAYQSSQRANQLAGEQRTFITMLSHEFRTPLAIIQRSAEILGLHLRNEPPAVHNRLATIRTNAGQLSGLVDAFLTKETLDSATFSTSREPVAIDLFLSDLISRRRRETPEQNVNLINSEFAIVEIDRILLERAMHNLIENARKYAPGASVWVACNRSANGYVYIRVVDDGPGIPPEDLNKVSNAFYRGKDSAVTQGVGLGLHITNRIIEAHKGTMSVSVGERGGTTVLLKLPYNHDATVQKTNEVFPGLSRKPPSKPSDRGR